MSKRRIAILVCLVIAGAVLGYFASNYFNGLAVQNVATDHVTANFDVIKPLPVNPWLNWTMAGINIAVMMALLAAGVLIGRKYEKIY